MDANQFNGSDNRDDLTTPDPCEACGSEPCLCAAIEAGEVCGRHRKVIDVGPYGVRYGGCEDCEPGDRDPFDGGSVEEQYQAAVVERERLRR